MSTTIQFSSNSSGLSPQFLVWDQDGQIWNTSIQVFQAYVTANRTNYETAMTELGTASKTYTAAMDPNIPSGDYNIEVREAAGEAASLGGIIDRIAWDGANFVLLSTAGIVDAFYEESRATHTTVGTFGEGFPIAPDGLNGVDTSDPIAAPANFTERLNWMFLKWNSSTLTEDTLTVNNFAGSSAITVQTVSNDGVIEILGKAGSP